MAKRKVGLHKELSAILNGVSIPKKNGAEQLHATTPDTTGYAPSKPLPQDPQTSQTPNPQPSAWSLPKVIPPKAVEKLRLQQAKDVGATKIFRQIPWQIFHSRVARS